ncbi:hypothetical protein NE237_028035 [Protea cynaroides]|uniref:Vacuolar iron transporter n=1 Tax=Protea cynaroides TaxID=273540 RepID=A0A9Q0GR91_9MAGN|nr:hypothetical protein NE237_028035 [Protea cynaroides]
MILVASAGLEVEVSQAATSEYISCHYKRDFELRYPTEEDVEESTVLQLRSIKEATLSVFAFSIGALTVVTGDMIIVASAGLVVGAFQAATIEYISCYYKRDFELRYPTEEDGEESTVLQLRPIKEATLSVLAFSIGGIIFILAVSFVTNNQWRIGLMIGVSSVTLALSRIRGAFMGMVPIMSTTLRMMIICLFAMGVSYVLTTLFS